VGIYKVCNLITQGIYYNMITAQQTTISIKRIYNNKDAMITAVIMIMMMIVIMMAMTMIMTKHKAQKVISK